MTRHARATDLGGAVHRSVRRGLTASSDDGISRPASARSALLHGFVQAPQRLREAVAPAAHDRRETGLVTSFDGAFLLHHRQLVAHESRVVRNDLFAAVEN